MSEEIAEPELNPFGKSRRNFLRDIGVGIGFLAAPGLASAQDSNLEKKIESSIKKLRREGRIEADEKTAWSVYDFTIRQKLVAINEEQPFQSASMGKPLVALAFLHEVNSGVIKYNSEYRQYMERMIRDSDNVSTNFLMQKIGGPRRAHQILRQYYGIILQQTSIIDYMPLTKKEKRRAKREGINVPSGKSYYSNHSSARDYSRLLYALWNNQLPYSQELKRLMALQKKDRIYDGTKVPEGTIIIDKTGSTGRLCGDMGVLVVKDRNGRLYPYTIIGIIQKDSKAVDYGKWIKSRGDVIREVSNIVYDYMKVKHKL